MVHSRRECARPARPREARTQPLASPRSSAPAAPTQVFTHKWSVNFAFLPEPAFLSRQLAAALLFLHLRLLWSLASQRWFAEEGGLAAALAAFWARRAGASGAASGAGSARGRGGAGKAGGGGARGTSYEDAALYLVFSANLAGMVASRTIHYQFYSWWVGVGGWLERERSGMTV